MTDEVLKDAVADPAAPVAAEPATPVAEAVLTPEQDDAAYEAAFNEAVAKREAVKSGDEPALEDPAKSKGKLEQEPAPAQAAAEPAPAAATPAVDPNAELLALVPEAQRDALSKRLKAATDFEAKAAKLELDNRSMAGRMSAYQRRYEEAAGKRPAEVKKAATEEQNAEWKQFAQDYPDIAKAIEGRVPATAGTSPDVAAVVEYVEQEKRNRFLHDAWDAVEAVHAGWQDKARSKDFQDWKATSPTYEKLAASDDISDAIALFDLYGAFTSRNVAPTPDPAQAAAAATLAARRGAQAEGARSPTNRATAPNQSVDLNDDDQLFAFYAQKSNARLKARYQ
jgi:hypothetical protein